MKEVSPMFSKRLQELRKQKDISQTFLGKQVNLSRSAIAMYENGERMPNYETLEALADYFNVSILYLLGKEKEPIDYLDEKLYKINEQLSDDKKDLLLVIAQQILDNQQKS